MSPILPTHGSPQDLVELSASSKLILGVESDLSPVAPMTLEQVSPSAILTVSATALSDLVVSFICDVGARSFLVLLCSWLI